MKKRKIAFLLILLISMLGNRASAHDIEVANNDGVTIYYNYINDNTELEVTYRGNSYSEDKNRYPGSVVIPQSVTYNGTTYPVTSIGEAAFSRCSGLTSIDIPSSVIGIGRSAFSDCSGLTSIQVEDGNSKYDSRDGCNAIVEIASNTLIAGCKNTTIPSSVTSIGYGAFSGCSGLTSITIPNSVTSIGESAFSSCSGLTSVDIPNSVTSIGNFAFVFCSGLMNITIPNSVTNIGSSTFLGTAWYRNQPDGLVYAGKLAYCYKGTMPSNTNIVIKDGTVGIAQSAFNRCTSLTSVTIPSSVTSIGTLAFSGCSGLTEVNYYALWCTTMGTSSQPAFLGCSSLATLNIGDKVEIIPDYAFCHCSGLTNVTIGNSVTSIGRSAFQYCSGLTSVTIGNSVTSIGDYAFSSCSGLTSFTIGNSVTSIGDRAFEGCSGLTSVKVPATDFSAFSRVVAFVRYKIRKPIIMIDADGNEITEYSIPEGVTSIGESAFFWCTGLTDIIIPNSVTSIGDYAFSNCSGLSSVTIGNSLTSIGDYALAWCNGLTSVTIGNSVTSIGEYNQEIKGKTNVEIISVIA